VTNEEVIQKLKASKGQRAEIARATGVPYGTLNKWVNGETNDPRGAHLDTVRDYFQRNQ
jgi:transcriptional regulator with XRE-family HTH domain